MHFKAKLSLIRVKQADFVQTTVFLKFDGQNLTLGVTYESEMFSCLHYKGCLPLVLELH